MDGSELAGLDGAEAQAVCEALGRYETTLQDAVREIHVDISVFKQGVERRVEEALGLVSPLGRAVAELQRENRQLRGQLEALTVAEVFSRNGTGEPDLCTAQSMEQQSSLWQGGDFIKAKSIDREELIDVDAAAAIGSNVVENGHQSGPDSPSVPQEVKSPPEPAPSYAAQEHTAPVALRMPHLPITATTKTADSSVATVTKTLESPTTPVRERAPPPAGPQPEPVSQSASSSSQSVPVAESAQQSGVSCPVKTWSPSPLRTMGSPRASDKPVPLTAKQSPAVSNAPSSDRSVDGFPESSPLPRVGDRRRELVRSQTLPRTMGAQTRRAPFERLDSDPSRPKVGDSKPKLKRSQSFGVSSASSIKQILLEWCRSKTIGYQNIDIQNFSSSWSDGMAFCALVHSFFPEEFDYNALSPANRKQNFELAFSKAEERAACDRLIEVEDMLVMGRKPDPMCVFTYVQSLYNHLRRFE
nr:PREDICTED: smoothelin-like protein 2 [Lepisosteus oculatus]